MCNVDRCAHWKAFDKPRFLKYHKSYVPLGDKDAYSGYCTRKDIGIRWEELHDGFAIRKRGICMTRSEKGNKDHLDFSRFPQGGHIPDPVSYDSMPSPRTLEGK